MGNSDARQDLTLVEVGRLGRAHGVRGEVKTLPTGMSAEDILRLDSVLVGADPGSATEVRIVSARLQHSRAGTVVLLLLEHVQTREEAEELRGTYMYCREGALPDGAPATVAGRNWIGYSVQSTDEVHIGEVADLISRPPQDLLLVTRADGSEILIPIVDAFIVGVDAELAVLRVDLIEGMT